MMQTTVETRAGSIAANAFEWNDSLTGDYLWTAVNAAEAVPDVMTPLTWSIFKIYAYDQSLPFKIPGKLPFAGNIGGRMYFNMSVIYSLYRLIAGPTTALRRTEAIIGQLPPGIMVRAIPFTLGQQMRTLPANLRGLWETQQLRNRLPAFLAAAPQQNRAIRRQIESAPGPAALLQVWERAFEPFLLCTLHYFWAGTTGLIEEASQVEHELMALLGAEDGSAILSNLSLGSDRLASLGPLLGLSQVVRGELSKAAYLEQYGHRGPHERECALPLAEEDAPLLDRQIANVYRSPVCVEALLERQRMAAEAAWQRWQQRNFQQARSYRKRMERVARAACLREGIRSETTRMNSLVRTYARRAGMLSDLEEGAFFLTIDELNAVLAGSKGPQVVIRARQALYARYCALPPYPTFIQGRFDPFQWAADPNRRSDLYPTDPGAPQVRSDAIRGVAGAAGRIEGRVRRLDRFEDGAQLQPGEVLVTRTTNVGWTSLFPQSAAIVTDIGAPLSHTAIVARELGIPAVVGCGDATRRLRTGDWVLVDGNQGRVQILKAVGR